MDCYWLIRYWLRPTENWNTGCMTKKGEMYICHIQWIVQYEGYVPHTYVIHRKPCYIRHVLLDKFMNTKYQV